MNMSEWYGLIKCYIDVVSDRAGEGPVADGTYEGCDGQE